VSTSHTGGAWSVRAARERDRPAILALVAAAFGGPSASEEEVAIVQATWTSPGAVPDLELVALVDDEVVGHLLGARGEADQGAVVTVAPLAVAPVHQGRGVGSALVRDLLVRAEEAGWSAVVLLGDPAYYQRFGFEPAARYGLSYPPAGPDSPHFLVRWLSPDRRRPRGAVRYCFEIAGGAWTTRTGGVPAGPYEGRSCALDGPMLVWP
jgi:putative acetyltransferase